MDYYEKNICLMSFLLLSSWNAFCQGGTIDSEIGIKSFVYKYGEPRNLESIYKVNAPDNGFGKYYIYNFKISKDISLLPFVYVDEKTRKLSGDLYSRCNIAIQFAGSVLIPVRRYSSDSSEDSSSCMGFENNYKVIKSSNNDVYYFVMNAIYKDNTDGGDRIKEVYLFYPSENKVCYSEDITEIVNKNKSYQFNSNKDDSNECNDK